MERFLLTWLGLTLFAAPFAVLLYRSRRDTIPPERRRLVLALLVLAMPLGVGVILGFLHQPKRPG